MAEFFQFMHYRWDVTKAKQLAQQQPVQRASVEAFFSWLALIWADEGHVDTTDLGEPLIVAKIGNLGGAALIIDGWHRLAKARREGVTHLPVVVLDEDQERQVRVYGGDLGPPALPPFPA